MRPHRPCVEVVARAKTQDGHTSTPTDRRAHSSCPSPILPGAAVLDPLALLALLASPCFRLARKMAPDATQFNDAMAAAGLDADRSAALAKIWQKKVSSRCHTPQAAHSFPAARRGARLGAGRLARCDKTGTGPVREGRILVQHTPGI